MRKTLWPCLAMFLMCLTAACQSSAPVSRLTDQYLGTVISITVNDHASNALIDSVFARIGDIHMRMAVTVSDSEVNRLNRDGAASLSPDTFDLVSLSKELSARSDGAYDITIGPLVALWDIQAENPHVPLEDEIVRSLALVSSGDMALDAGRKTVSFQTPGMQIDLGGVAKGYACDESVRMLREAGVQSAMLDLGGNVFVLGRRPDGSDWRVGLRTPVIGETGTMAVVTVQDTAVVTSGGYERYFESGGVFYHHILDPHTGYPAQNGLLSAVIVSDNATLADALSTACFVLGADKGRQLLETYDGVEGVFVGSDMTVSVTPGLRDKVEITDTRFRLVS